MPDPGQILLFIIAGWLLNLTPGPDVLYIVTHSLRSGSRAGLVAASGIIAGCFVHVLAGAVGVSALLAASATAFTILKLAGAAYLLWIGVRMLLARASGPASDLKSLAHDLPPAGLRKVFLGAFWTNVLNPKVALFFLAFLPQFISPDASGKPLVFLALGVLFNVNSIPVNAGWALAAAWMARRDAARRAMRWLDKVAGAMFVAFGLRLALAERPAG